MIQTDPIETPRRPDALAELRASGDCAPADWGFILDHARIARLQQLIDSGKRVPAWALRECRRLQVPLREPVRKAA